MTISTPTKNFPFEAFPPIIKSYAEVICRFLQVSEPIVGSALLSVTSLLVQNHREIKIDFRSIPLSLATLIVADSGERKTTVDKILLEPIRNKEKELFQTYPTEKFSHTCLLDLWKKETKDFLSEGSAPDFLKPDSPPHPKILMQEPTIEGISKQFEIAANKAGRPDLIEKIRQSGTLDGVEDCPEEMRRVFATSGDISVYGHVKMQAAIQNNGVDSAVSKTINLPNSATVEDVLKCYTDAHAMGLKGITVYRTGSRQHVVIETKETAESDSRGSEPGSVEPGSCPICEKDTLIKESGCSRCTSCDYAVCG